MIDEATGAWLRGIQASGQDPVEAAILARYGYMGAFLHEPEIGPLLRQAALGGWTKEVLQGALYKTAWYQNASAQSRQWMLLQSSDPAEAQRLLSQKNTDIMLMFTQSGIKADKGLARVSEIAQMALAQGLSDAQIKMLIASEAHWTGPEGKGNTIAGTMQAAQSQVQAMAYDMLLPMSDQTAFDWAKKLLGGLVTQEAVAADIRNQAMSRFPQFADEITRGANLKQIAAPYVEQTAKLLDISPETIDMTKDKWSRMIDTRDADGQRTSMSLADAATYVRKTDEWQYTDAAHEQAATMASTIAKTFGKVA